MSAKKNTFKSLENILILGALIAVGMRFIFLGTINGGLHVDEAYAGYEAYSLYNYGVDSWGYHNPVYFISWGSGMNVLASYLMIPFVAVLGNSVWAIRLPQAILQSLAILTVYKILKMTVNKRLAAYTAFFMAVCPWHFMLSRWGLESNMCVAFITFGSYFLIKYYMIHIGMLETGKKGDYNLLLSALMFGLSLYCYAADWVPVAAILSFWLIYYIIFNIVSAKKTSDNNSENATSKNAIGRKHKIGYIIGAILILALFALPLLLFLLVNMGYIPEIRSFISVPKMVVFRNDELGANLHSRIHSLAYILIKGTDVDGFRMWNAYQPYGLFYIFSLPVMMVGVFGACRQVVVDFKKDKFSFAFMLLGYSVIASCIAMVQGIDIIQINYLIITMVIYIGIGIYIFSKVCFKKEKDKAGIINLGSLLIIAYLVSFIFFSRSYFGDFQKRIGPCQMRGADKALDYALNLYQEKDGQSHISVTPGLRHANILFYTASSPYDFIDTVTWQNYPDKYLNTASFGPYIWEDYRNEHIEIEDEEEQPEPLYTLNPDNIYIIEKEETDQFIIQGYDVTYFQDTAVAIKK